MRLAVPSALQTPGRLCRKQSDCLSWCISRGGSGTSEYRLCQVVQFVFHIVLYRTFQINREIVRKKNSGTGLKKVYCRGDEGGTPCDRCSELKPVPNIRRKESGCRAERKRKMKRIPWNEDWCFSHLGEETKQPVTLPHDAMLREERTEESAGGTNTGWFREADYLYEKTFTAPEEWKDREVWVVFESIYHHAEITVNGKALEVTPNGYLTIRKQLNPYLVFGGENVIRVIARNSQQPCSRWYSGAGIYRPVWLELLPKEHILPESICIRTEDWEKRAVHVVFRTSHPGTVRAEVLDGERALAQADTASGDVQFTLTDAELWSPAHPRLYECRLTFGEDVQTVRFGIRQILCDAKHGFCINGERTLLLGACIHHDNGLLGAIGHPFAERRKIELLKKAGYNAIRSAHNPVSPAILDACDELGVLVLDEYVDMWYIHKTVHDYAGYFEKNWREDLKNMVEKDRNHPSVVMYSIGNEVSETAQKKGIELTGEMRDYLHTLDDRPVTCGINIFFNYLSSMGFGVYSDEKAKQEAAKAEKSKGKKKKKAVGSEFINSVAGLLGAGFMKFGATLHGSDVKTRDAFAKLDVAGYNYGVNRYQKDLKKYPDRVILGSETFAEDAATFYNLAQKNAALIGDFVWTGMDYLGEIGLGAWEYSEYAPTFEHGPGWLTAGAGTIDLVGTETCQMAYTQAAFGLSPVRIGVVPVKFAKEKHSPAAWRFTNAVESWSWEGCEGMPTTVEVYGRGAEAELQLNGKTVGRKTMPRNCRTQFHVTYAPGELTAIVYDAQGHETARTTLRSAEGKPELRLTPEKESLKRGDLLYVRLRYTDSKGTVLPLARGEIQVQVQGGKLLGLGSACSYSEKGYLTDRTDTYYGEALAIIEPKGNGSVEVRAQSPHGSGSVKCSCAAENA